MIYEPIREFVKSCSQTFPEQTVSVESLYRSQIGMAQREGSGICIKMDASPLNPRTPSPDETGIWFTLSDGNYAIECLVHNGYSVPSGFHSNELLEETMMALRDSLRNGRNIVVSGEYHIVNRDRVFLVNKITPFENMGKSQMTDEQLSQFLDLCSELKVTPLDIMMEDETLWREFYAPDVLKKAVMLYCLSPQKKSDLMHIGLVTSMGEGKDHLIERVVQPLVPVGVAGSGKMSTIAGLFGAMNGDDLSSIELGLIPKMNHERMAVSEFQTWDDTVFGELMNVMANGKFEMQKGQLDISRPGCVNMMFLGNPPKHWTKDHDNADMLESFGDYTYQILSRLTLIFTQMSISGDEAETMIEDKIMDAMNGDFEDPKILAEMEMWRRFFKEYLRKVSAIIPDISAQKGLIRDTYHESIKKDPIFKAVFLERSEKDMRKYQSFTNLCRSFARLEGCREVTPDHITEATEILQTSIKTLHETFPLDELRAGMTGEQRVIYQAIKEAIGDAESVELPTLRAMMVDQKVSDSDLDTLESAKYLRKSENQNGTIFITITKK